MKSFKTKTLLLSNRSSRKTAGSETVDHQIREEKKIGCTYFYRRLFLLGFSLLVFILQVQSQSAAPVWKKYVQAYKNGKPLPLPDFSYAGYHFSEREIPDVSDRMYFNVTDYGAAPDDKAYDDKAIQKAIHAAEKNPSGGVIFFPPGKYMISPDHDGEKHIRISQSNIVLKGSGTGPGGTELFMDKMRTGTRQFHFKPEERSSKTITTVTKDAPRGSFWLDVAYASRLQPGQDLVIYHRSEAFTRLYFKPLELNPEWDRLFGPNGGMRVNEIHTVEKIVDNRIKFENPIHFDLQLVEEEDFEIRTYSTIRECGIEDILFTSSWDDYSESFDHHKNSTHDSGWSAVSMEYVKDSWIRNAEFRSWNEAVFIRGGYRVSVEDVTFSGKKGHSSVHSRTGNGVLIKNCRFEAGNHHGPGTGYSGVGMVATQCTMQEDQNIDSHSGQPYAILFDDIEGGVFRNIGGPWPGYPQSGKYLVFWNFRHRSFDDHHYNFWSLDDRENHTFAFPLFVGFRADTDITFENEGLNEMPKQMVEPRSLFEAQLRLRLKNENKGSDEKNESR